MEVFLIYSINFNGKQITFSSTSNAFHNYWPNSENIKEKDIELNKLCAKAYKASKKIVVQETDYGFNEELLMYNDYLFCFISSNSHKILFNYMYAKDLFLNNIFPNLTKYQISKIHDISLNEIIGNVKITLYNGTSIVYTVIASFDALLSYSAINSTILHNSCAEKLLFRDFLYDLTSSKINASSIDSNLGLTIALGDSPHLFNYLYFDNLMIITSYQRNI
ncbi:hypothetical protein [Clostridium sp. OS1-26]|uniref:hypothetical protein n=1 Tax=Clostridium sp. OS1-26 TaxID=3070681 RepID=UPI0027DFE486|nr:hypothetical protein [Clostridium sp. OS1-26]WML33740.1 hypothetical protein RCG18_20735 [Clostridium sp. OS1-26]